MDGNGGHLECGFQKESTLTTAREPFVLEDRTSISTLVSTTTCTRDSLLFTNNRTSGAGLIHCETARPLSAAARMFRRAPPSAFGPYQLVIDSMDGRLNRCKAVVRRMVHSSKTTLTFIDRSVVPMRAAGDAILMILGALTCPMTIQAVAAQRLPRHWGVVNPSTAPARLMLPVQERERRSSTGIERFLWGFGVGTLATLTVTALQGEAGKDRPVPALIAYVSGSALGVGLVTAAREGLRPRSLLLGTAAGTGIGLAAILGACRLDRGSDIDSPSECGFGGATLGILVIATAVPLGASEGHRLSW